MRKALGAGVDLFNKRSYPKYHDLLFNILALLLPAFIVFWFAVRRRLSPGRRVSICLATLSAAFTLCMLPVFPRAGGVAQQAVWDDRPAETHTSVWRTAEPQAAGWEVFAPIPHRWDATYAGASFKPGNRKFKAHVAGSVALRRDAGDPR